MTAKAVFAGAPSGDGGHWHGIDWARCHLEVKRLQARIVKATKEGCWGKVKALQWLLTHSFSGKALAVRRVTENQGKKTAGVDKVTWSTPDAKYQAIEALVRRGYVPQPLRRISIPKKNGKLRPLGIPCMVDRAQQALYLLALAPISETMADPHSYGFRPERSTADAIEQCFTVLANRYAPEWILEGDIEACFDKISHDWLLANVPMDKAILQKWLKAGYIENRRLFPTEAGTPQGGIISPALSNWTLDGLQKRLEQVCGKRRNVDGKRIGTKMNFIRYADDFIITGTSREMLEKEVMPAVESFMRERGLRLSPEKTRITHIAEGFDFLGQNIRKYNGKLLIKPSKTNVQAFLAKVRTTIKDNWTATQINLIRLLNPMIKGWANYHRHVVSKKVFNVVDSQIWRVLWQWCCRRHPNKRKDWIKHRYFHCRDGRSWVFTATSDKHQSDGKPMMMILWRTSDIPIRRHTKIKSEANPFDPAWEIYFEDRIGLKMFNALAGRKKLIRLWFDQQGACIVCGQRITKETGWHVHHIVRRIDGGNNAVQNLVMVHPTCHNQIHSLGMTVTKPAPTKGL
ncbi:MAG: reverse transcriptase [Burkholderia sp.]|jgi:RNA-directed DNA polymerase|nr:reverse transcriptase [Burkholderia sp.]